MVSDPAPEFCIPRLTPGQQEENSPVPPVPLDLSLPDRCVNIVGDRATGKSTLLRHLARRAAPNELLVLDDATPDAAAHLARANPHHRIFVATDGLSIPGFASRELLPFDRWAIREFFDRWAARHPFPDSSTRIHWLITSHPDLEQLASHPTILTHMAAMVSRGDRLPQQRAELYSWILENLGPLDHSALRLYQTCVAAPRPPDAREPFCLYGAIHFRRAGQPAIEQIADSLLAAGGPSLTARASAIARIHALESDLNCRVESPNYRTAVLSMTELFAGTPESAAVPLADKITAAEALGRLGDPRLRFPADPEYWATLGDLQLGRHPVTVHEFQAYVDATGFVPLDWPIQQEYPSRPVTGVGWYQAVAYCRWAGGHLPTPAEWESALADKFPWGNEEPGALHANTNECQIGHPTPVGLFPRGNTPRTGIADLYGNVWEWVDQDVTRRGEMETKATRGASCRTYAVRPHGRWDAGERGHDIIGFRCARRKPI